MATITRSTAANLLVEGIKLNFGTGYKQADKNYLKVFDSMPSNSETEQYQETSGFGLHSIKAEGQTSQLQSIAQGPKTYIENKSYSLRYNVSHEMLSDVKYQKALTDALDMGKSAANTIETVCMDRLNTAFSTNAADLLADGSALCANNHALSGTGGTSSNVGTASALNETSLAAAQVTITDLKDPAGNRIDVKGQMLVVSKEDEITAQKLLFSTLTIGNNNNDLNPFARSYGRIPKGYISSPYLTDENAFFIRTNIRGMVFQEREKPRIMEDFKNAQMTRELVSFMRFGVGVYDFRSIYGNPGQ